MLGVSRPELFPLRFASLVEAAIEWPILQCNVGREGGWWGGGGQEEPFFGRPSHFFEQLKQVFFKKQAISWF